MWNIWVWVEILWILPNVTNFILTLLECLKQFNIIFKIYFKLETFFYILLNESWSEFGCPVFFVGLIYIVSRNYRPTIYLMKFVINMESLVILQFKKLDTVQYLAFRHIDSVIFQYLFSFFAFVSKAEVTATELL